MLSRRCSDAARATCAPSDCPPGHGIHAYPITITINNKETRDEHDHPQRPGRQLRPRSRLLDPRRLRQTDGSGHARCPVDASGRRQHRRRQDVAPAPAPANRRRAGAGYRHADGCAGQHCSHAGKTGENHPAAGRAHHPLAAFAGRQREGGRPAVYPGLGRTERRLHGRQQGPFRPAAGAPGTRAPENPVRCGDRRAQGVRIGPGDLQPGRQRRAGQRRQAGPVRRQRTRFAPRLRLALAH